MHQMYLKTYFYRNFVRPVIITTINNFSRTPSSKVIQKGWLVMILYIFNSLKNSDLKKCHQNKKGFVKLIFTLLM